MTDPRADPPYSGIDSRLGETLYDNEEQLAYQIVEEGKKTVDRYYAKHNEAFRDAHAKTIGCVKAKFRVNEELDPEIANKGVFVPGAEYDALIRFSHSHEDPDAKDHKPGIRGMAVKLKEISNEEGNKAEQDFVMFNHNVFFVDDPAKYLAVVKFQNANLFLKLITLPRLIWALWFRGLLNLAQMGFKKKISNPFMASYFSVVAYRLGNADDHNRLAIKFSARPVPDRTGSSPETEDETNSKPDPNYLRKTLRNILVNGNARMEFSVQKCPKEMSTEMRVENSRIEWDESISPFVPVAVIDFPMQSIAEEEENGCCEALSFNPWNALGAHRPLGVLNRLRKVVYPAISEYRNRRNKEVPSQPVLGKKPMEQYGFTIVTEIKDAESEDAENKNPKIKVAHLEELNEYLTRIGDNIKDKTQNNIIDFSKFGRLHYCCFVILNGKLDTGPPVLVFEGNIDGPPEEFLKMLCETNPDFLSTVYGHCKNCPEPITGETLVSYLLNNDKGYNAFYVGHPGRTVAEIRREKTLFEKIRDFLQKKEADLTQNNSQNDIRQCIQEEVCQDSEFQWAKKVPRPSFYVQYRPWFLGLNGLGVLIIIVGLFGFPGFFTVLFLVTAYGIWSRSGAYGIESTVLEKGGVRWWTGIFIALNYFVWSFGVLGFSILLFFAFAYLYWFYERETEGEETDVIFWNVLLGGLATSMVLFDFFPRPVDNHWFLPLLYLFVILGYLTWYFLREKANAIYWSLLLAGVYSVIYLTLRINLGLIDRLKQSALIGDFFRFVDKILDYGSEILKFHGYTGLIGLSITLFLATAYGIWLQRRERLDEQDEVRWKFEKLKEVQYREDRQQQNHLTSVSYLKPGRLRLFTLHVILSLAHLGARWVSTKGNLAGIVTIHFARWVIIDGGINGGKRLLFFSNYDGSWENYLGEFIDHAHKGLTAIWSNTRLGEGRGFPKTQALQGGGALDEQRFKFQVRNSQRTEQIWYSAYPDLSVKNIGNNKKIRDQLLGDMTDEDLHKDMTDEALREKTNEELWRLRCTAWLRRF